MTLIGKNIRVTISPTFPISEYQYPPHFQYQSTNIPHISNVRVSKCPKFLSEEVGFILEIMQKYAGLEELCEIMQKM